jgi:hypothetical protein
MPYILIGRYEERRLAQFKNNLKINSIYNIPVKKRDVRSPEVLYNLNIKKRICELRKRDKKNL